MRYLLVTSDYGRGHIAEDYPDTQAAEAARLNRLDGCGRAERMTSTLLRINGAEPPAFIWSRTDCGTGKHWG